MIIFFKILALVWVGLFLYGFTTSMLQDDPKFGRFNWQVSLAVAFYVSTVIPISALRVFLFSIPLAITAWRRK